jgi:hypothetical protein
MTQIDVTRWPTKQEPLVRIALKTEVPTQCGHIEPPNPGPEADTSYFCSQETSRADTPVEMPEVVQAVAKHE